MFGQQTSNVVEQHHASDKKSGLRDSHPLDYLMGALQAQHECLNRMFRAVEKVPSDQILVPFAEKKRNEFLGQVPNYSVIPADNSGKRFYVHFVRRTRGQGLKSQKFIDLDKPWEAHGSCNWSQQFCAPCQHYYAGLHYHPKDKWLSLLGCATEEEMHEKLFHRGYLMKNVREALEGELICMPCIDDVAHDGLTKRPAAASEADLSQRKKQKRMPSKGES
jgi:hypothetical protein